MATMYVEPNAAETDGTYRIVLHHFRNLLLVSLGAALIMSAVAINELNKGVNDFQNKCAYIQTRLAQM